MATIAPQWIRPFAFLSVLAAASAVFAASVSVTEEATVRGGAHAQTDQDESEVDYIHVKHSDRLSTARKAYFQFDFAETEADLSQPAAFTFTLAERYKQAVQVWVLDQAYDDFSATVTWDTAQANHTDGNRMHSAGEATATRVGAVVVAEEGTGSTVRVELDALEPHVFDGKVTFVITGVANAKNDAAGLRIERGSAALEISDAE